MNVCFRRWSYAAAVGLAISPVALQAARLGGTILVGDDAADFELPAALPLEPYANAAYRLDTEGLRARVEVSLGALTASSPWRAPARSEPLSPVGRTSRAVASGARSVHEVVTRVLSWIGREIHYELDRSIPQDSETVLARRAAYCTGMARLAVAMLGSLGISAREVPGLVLEEGRGWQYHRWIEVAYPGVGWIFSDPRSSVGFVPATYLRLSAEEIPPDEAPEVKLLARQNRLRPIDVTTDPALSRLLVAASFPRERFHAALRVAAGKELAGGRAVLTGSGAPRVLALDPDGTATFVGLRVGEYLLKVEGPTGEAAWKQVRFHDAVYAELELKRFYKDHEEIGPP